MDTDTATATTSDITPGSVILEVGEKVRRGNGILEKLIKSVTDAYAQGLITVEDGAPLTPYRIARIIDERTGTKTSTGAVTECLKRWRDIGFAELASGDDTPMAFAGYTDAAREHGLSALKARSRAAKKEAKAAATAAAKTPFIETGPVADDWETVSGKA